MEAADVDLTLELSPAEMRRLVDEAMERIVRFFETLPEQSSKDTEGAPELARQVIEPLPRGGGDFQEMLGLLFDRWIPKTFNTAGPGYLAYIPGGGLFQTALAELIANAVNRYVGVWAAAPALAQLEATVVQWFCEIVGYPKQARGFLTSGGSLSNLSAVVTARREKLGEDFLSGTLYASGQVHHCVMKAALLAGIPSRNIREVEVDSGYRIRTADLAAKIEADRSRGLKPFLAVASSGTTNTGAIDDLQRVADICAENGLWFHIDAAYGGFFMLTGRGRERMRGIERADSITLDPHKGLFLPYGTGALLARDGEALRRAHSVHGAYMPPMQDHPERVDFCEISPELSRGFRGLRVWLPFKLHGVEPFVHNLDEKLDLASWVYERLRGLDGIEIVAPPQLSVLAFRWFRPGVDEEELNRRNQEFLAAINRPGRVYLTPTTLDGRFVIRICVLSFRTHLERIEACLEDIRAALAEIDGQ